MQKVSHRKYFGFKNTLFFWLMGIILLSFSNTSCTETDIYIVRHAEKDTIPEGNPRLTTAGMQRAQELANFLKDKHITAIYTTNTARTISTAHPASDISLLPIFIYDSIPALVKSIPLNNHENILIVGHSNTILDIAKALDGQPTIQTIGDNDFDNIFILKKRKGIFGSSTEMEEMTYGVPTQ